MKFSKQDERIPKATAPIFEKIALLTDQICQGKLNKDYAILARKAIASLARKRPSPLLSGNPKTWACGIIYALGSINYLYDKSQNPHLPASEICEYFELSSSTGSAKAKLIRTLLKMNPLDHNWCLPQVIENLDPIWMVSIDGFILDIRDTSREIQEIAFQKGIIPYIPE